MLQGIYAISIRSLANDKARLMGVLDDGQRERARAFRREDDALRSLAGGLLARYIAGGKTVKYAEKGKPYVAGGPFFNVSHAGDYAVMVSGTVPVGIDIEHTGNPRGGRFASLAKAFFHPDELRYANESPGPRRFYEIWTQKEAFVKMKGDGLGIGLKTFSVLNLGGRGGTGSVGQPAYTRLFWDLDPYIIAVCSVEPVAVEAVTVLRADVFRVMCKGSTDVFN
jgi:4'-phosphopantetheinyl transferase